MNRREFLGTTFAAGLALSAGNLAYARVTQAPTRRFRLNYAPHFGMFRHHGGDELLDQIHFMADEGFAALEDVGLKSRPLEEQRQIARTLESRGMQMGLFTAAADYGQPTFASGRRDLSAKVLSETRAAVETARRFNARYCSLVIGKADPRLPERDQNQNAVDLLKRCVDLCEPAGVVLLVEPLNHWGAHPLLFLHALAQAFELCRSVGSPHCKILFDVYQQHMLHEGDVVNLLQNYWPQIGYVQFGDNPGRKEPGTGHIDFRRIVGFLQDHNYTDLVGMDHGNSHAGSEGEQAVIDAYAPL